MTPPNWWCHVKALLKYLHYRDTHHNRIDSIRIKHSEINGIILRSRNINDIQIHQETLPM